MTAFHGALISAFCSQLSLSTVQGHKVQRLELQEVAKLGKGTDSTAASQDVKKDEQAQPGALDSQADSKDKDAINAGGRQLYISGVLAAHCNSKITNLQCLISTLGDWCPRSVSMQRLTHGL